jgi:hypothetical protein
MQDLVKLGLTSGCKDARRIVDEKTGAKIIYHAIMRSCAKFWLISTCFVLLVLMA